MENFLKNIKPREYQQKIFETCTKKNCLVVLPTGLGKTLIALMLTIERMKKFPGQKVVLLAPTKPLAEQQLNSFKKYLPELFADMQLFTGQIKASKRKEIWKRSDIIFSTPQCVANDIKKELYSLEEVSLLIQDEAHRCAKNYDYNFLAKKYISQAINPRILGLTASPGSDTSKIKEICKNLSIEEVELRTRESPDVKPFLQELEFEKETVNFPPELEEIRHVLKKILDQYIVELRKRKVLFGHASKTELLKLQKNIMGTLARGNKNFNYMLAASACAQSIKVQHALELLETQTLYSFDNYLKNLFNQAEKKQSKGVVKLVKKPEFNFIYSASNELLFKNKEHPKLERLIEIIKEEKEKNKNMKIIVFTQFRDSATIISKKINKLEGVSSNVFVGQAKRSDGSGLNQKEQKEMIDNFSKGKINVLCATCIAEEGLDIPEVNAVIFYEPVPSAIRSIQRRGRTARLMSGKMIMMITKDTRDETFYYISRAREKKMYKSIDTVKKQLSNGSLYSKKEQQIKL